MKFIKDIIGEKREQGPMSLPQSGAAAPERDMLTTILAETRANTQPPAPLQLDAAARVHEAGEPTPAREPVREPAPEPVTAPESLAPSTAGHDALESFLAKQDSAVAKQDGAAAEAAAARMSRPVNARPRSAPAPMPEPQPVDMQAPEETADQRGLPEAEAARPDGVERPYRIFTRRNRTKMLQLEAAAKAAHVAREERAFPDADRFSDADSGEPEEADPWDAGPDEFLHVRSVAAAAEEPMVPEEELNDLEDVLSPELATFPSDFSSRRGQRDPHQASGQALAPDPQMLVTDPASTSMTQDVAKVAAAENPQSCDLEPVTRGDPDRGPSKPDPSKPDPSLGAPFPEPAFADTAAAAGVDLGEADLGLPTGLPTGRAGRVKTRLLGFDGDAEVGDPFAQNGPSGECGVSQFPVGWLVVVEGPGRGAGFTLFAGVSVIGRGEGQTIRLDFGDGSISRDQHAAIAFDPEQQGFFIGHGGKANLVRRNGRPVLSTEALAAGDLIRVGETTLRFVPLCGPDFSWQGGAHLD